MKNKLIGMALLIATVPAFNSLNAQKTNSNENINTITSRNSFTDGDKTESTVHFTENGQRFKMRLANSKITELYVDDKKIDEADYSKYEVQIKKVLEQLERDRVQAEKDRAQAAIDRGNAAKDREQAERDRERAFKDRQQAALDREQAVKDRSKGNEDRKQAELDRAQAVKDREQAEGHRKQAEIDRANAVKDRQQAELDRAQAEKDRAQAAIDRARAAEDRKLMMEILDELVIEKIADSKSAITSVLLNANELTVNGTRQPDALHKRFKAKYLKKGQEQIDYRRSVNSNTLSVI